MCSSESQRAPRAAHALVFFCVLGRNACTPRTQHLAVTAFANHPKRALHESRLGCARGSRAAAWRRGSLHTEALSPGTVCSHHHNTRARSCVAAQATPASHVYCQTALLRHNCRWRRVQYATVVRGSGGGGGGRGGRARRFDITTPARVNPLRQARDVFSLPATQVCVCGGGG